MRAAPKPSREEAPKASAEPAPEESAPRPSKKERPEKGSAAEKPAKAGKAKKTPAGAPPGGPAKGGKPVPENPNFRYIVRVAGSDLDGRRPAALAITGVRGVGRRVAEVACRIAQVNPSEMIGNLPETAVDGLEAILGKLPESVPTWMVNHPVDLATGENHHYFGADLETSRRDDLNVMRMIRSYRGVRHERGQKVRGQRTRSNGRTGMAAGVLKKAAKEAAKAKESAAAPAAPTAAAPPATPEKKE